MPQDRIVFDDGVRFTDNLQVRVPADFRARMQAAAEAEGLPAAEFCRRAIAERMARGTASETVPGGTPAHEPQQHQKAKHHV